MPERLEQYLTQIGEQIRWKRARPMLLRELENHALEQLDTCLESGLSQEEAEAETLRQLGDPLEIGRDLDRLHQPKPQWGLLLLMAAWKDWFCVGRKRGMLCTVSILFIGGSIFFWIGNQAVAARLYNVFHPEQDPLGNGYMAMTIRSALEGSQLWGAGESSGQWAGLNYWSVVPEGANDAFLVTVIHMLGWIPFFLLIGILAALLLWGVVKALRQKNMAAKFLATSILTIFMVHMLMSLMLTCGYVLLGAFCPFLKMSAETVLDMGLMGMLLSVFRQETLPYDGVVQKPQRPKGRWKLIYVPAEE